MLVYFIILYNIHVDFFLHLTDIFYMYTVTRVFKFITIFVFYRKWKIIQHLVIFHRLFCFDKFVLQVFFDINLLYTNEMPQMYFEMEGQCDTLDVQ